jgi:hypothetical protein
MKKLTFLFVLFGASYAIAQTVAPVATPGPVPTPALVTGIESFINVHVMGLLGGLAVLIEFLMRALKTQKPMSILYFVSAVCHWVGDIASGLSKALDQLIQNVNSSQPAAQPVVASQPAQPSDQTKAS